MKLEERFYTSTEVAEILGVSLRSIYRYLEENKLKAEIKTATGRHRFTRQNILDFLYPSGVQEEGKVVEEKQPDKLAVKVEEDIRVEKIEVEPETQETPAVEEEPVDWLSKFREAAKKYQQEQHDVEEVSTEPSPLSEPVSGLTEQEPEEEKELTKTYVYYRSGVGGLKDIAQNLDKSARKSALEYAFTMNAGLSLHKPIKPFSLLHSYIKPIDRDFFERMLQLTESTKNNAQICLIYCDDEHVFKSRKEMHGLYVVDDLQLKNDLMDAGEGDLARELE